MDNAVSLQAIPSAAPSRTARGVVTALVVLALMVAAPLVLDRYWLALAIGVLFWTYLSSCWNIVGGLAGQFSLGHAAFFGMGAYASAWLYAHYGLSPWLGAVAGVGVAAVVSAILGAFTFRYKLTGAYFAIGTLAFSEVIRTLAGSLPFLGQGGGITVTLSPTPGWRILQFQQPVYFYYILLAMASAVLLVVWLLSRSRFGYRLACIRDSEAVAASLGIDANRMKLAAFVLSAALAAPAGTIYAQYLMFVDPNTFLGLGVAIQIVLPAVIGGTGTVFGPVFGAILLAAAVEGFNRFSVRPGLGLFAYGMVLMLSAVFLPRGLWPAIAGFFKRRFGWEA